MSLVPGDFDNAAPCTVSLDLPILDCGLLAAKRRIQKTLQPKWLCAVEWSNNNFA
jgi:hypothetical protein